MGTDERITADVVDQLVWDDRVDASMIAVTVDQGEVMLEGKVPTHTARWAAEDDARLVAGVRTVNNALRVDSLFMASRSPAPSDAEILAEVERALASSAALDGHTIQPTVAAGWVTLDGSVNAYWRKTEAEHKVLDLRGVLGVTNKVAVVPTESVSDDVIAKGVMDAIGRNANVSLDDVEVSVVDGRVILDGVVPNGVAQVAAHNAARYTAGVQDVEDRLVVSYQM